MRNATVNILLVDSDPVSVTNTRQKCKTPANFQADNYHSICPVQQNHALVISSNELILL